MSTERRHELEKNDLVILLDRVIKAVKPYSNLIAIGLVSLFVGFIGWLFYGSQQSGQRSDATLELVQGVASQDAEVLMEVSSKFPGTAAASWAKVYQGQLLLSEGIQTLYRDREEAMQLLDDAKLALESAMASSTDPLLRSRAQLGIARTEESLGNLEAATDAYQQVIATNESEAIVKQAERRILALKDPKTKEFLAWFGDQNFDTADFALPPSLSGLDSLPDMPDLSFTELPGGDGEIGDGIELSETENGEPEMESGESEAESEEPEAESNEAETKSDEPEAESDEPEAAEADESAEETE